MSIAGSGEISVGMLNFEIMSGDASDTATGETATSNDSSNNDFAALSNNFSANAGTVGDVSRANLVAGPYGLNEFYNYRYSSCLLVGTEILMADGSVRFVEDLLIDDELFSVVFSDMTKANYKKYSIENLNESEKATGLVKTLVFDFKDRYWVINNNLKCTGQHAIFAWKNKIKKFEWWLAKDLEIGDKVVTSDLKLEEIITLEQMHGDAEVVTVNLTDIYTYFANGYLCHQ